jgi:hypothetical protein
LSNDNFLDVTQPPPKTQDLGILLRHFISYAGISTSEYAALTAKFTRGKLRSRTISEDSVKDYVYKGKFPNSYGRNTIKLVFEEACDESVKQLWLDAFSEIENINTLSKLNNKQRNSKINQGPQELESSDKETSRFDRYKNTFSFKLLFLILIALSIFIIFILFIINNEKKTIVSTVTKPTPALKEVIISQEESLKNTSKEPIKREPHTTKTLSKGLSLDVYSLGKNKYRHLPSQPEGFKVATLPFNKGYFSFIDHIVDKNINNATMDRDIGLDYQGFIYLTGNGEFLFQLDYQSGFHDINQFFKKCRFVLKVNNATIFDKEVSVGQGQSYSVQKMSRFSNGLNPFDFWFTCNNLRSFSPKQDYKAFKDTSVTLYLKQPDDNRILQITPDLFSYNPDKD